MILLVLSTGCAHRLAPVPTVTAPLHPDYVFPAVPASFTRPELTLRQQRGWQFMQAGDNDGAVREFQTALKLNPRFYPADAGLAYASLAAGDPNGAEGRFHRVLEAEPRYAPALVGRGDALVALSRLDEAIESYEAALAEDPGLVEVRRRVDTLSFRNQQASLQSARDAAAAGRYDQAALGYERAIAASPDSAFLYRELAGVERSQGRADRALEHLRRATALDPGDVRAWTQTGELLEQAGDLPGAVAAYEKAWAIEPGDQLRVRLDRACEALALARLPAEYREIAAAPMLTRGQLAALVGVQLERLLEGRQRRVAVVLTDIRGHWASDWIQAAVRAGIMEAYPNHTFGPRGVVRRLELARVVSRVLNLVAHGRPQQAQQWVSARPVLTDVPSGHLGYPAAAVAVSSGVMSLIDGAFRPGQPVSGAEAIEVVKRLEVLAR